MKKPTVVLIAGPTGVGKTEASIILAKKLNTEIVSCDSMQIYRGMDIGTAKVTPEEAQGIVHHMTDIVEASESFSVCDYVALASEALGKIIAKGKIPLVVGGTGLYADSLLKGIAFEEKAPADEEYRARMNEVYRQKGAEYVHSLLCKVDSASAEAIHPNNIKRVIRALEYHHATGEKISDYNERTKSIPSPYNAIRIYFTRDRENLYKRINLRVDKMIADGLEAEVRALVASGADLSATSMQALGYKEMAEYIDGKVSFEDAVENIKKLSRNYAKRQLTWFRRDEGGIWLDLDRFASAEETAQKCFEIVSEAERSAQ